MSFAVVPMAVALHVSAIAYESRISGPAHDLTANELHGIEYKMRSKVWPNAPLKTVTCDPHIINDLMVSVECIVIRPNGDYAVYSTDPSRGYTIYPDGTVFLWNTGGGTAIRVNSAHSVHTKLESA